MSVRATNTPRFFFSTVRSRSSRALKAVRLAAAADRVESVRVSDGQQWWWPSVAQLLSGQVDEDGLEGGLGHRQVGDIEASLLGGGDHLGQHAGRAFDVELDGAADRLALGRPLDPVLKDPSEGIEVAGGRHGHDAVRANRLLEAFGVSMARMRPWSMMASRSQTESASSI